MSNHRPISDDVVIRGAELSPDDVAERDALLKITDPKTSLDRIDSYGKWLFASATIVGSLGAGFSNSAIGKLQGPALWSFGIALMAIGVALVAAAWSVAPRWSEIRSNDLPGLRDSVIKMFQARKKCLTTATVFFVIALTCAGLSPFLQLVLATPPRPTVRYTLDDKGTFEGTIEGSGLTPGHIVRAKLSMRGKILIEGASTVDQTGQVKAVLRSVVLNGTPALILTVCFEAPLGTCRETITVPVTPS